MTHKPRYEDPTIKQHHTEPTARRSPWVKLGVLATLVLAAVMVFNAIPKGFKTTHEEIGTGKPAVVFVYDPNFTVSNAQTEQMNEARRQIGDTALFLIARVGSPTGEEFRSRYRANSAEILLFSPSGQLLERDRAVRSAGNIIQWLQSAGANTDGDAR
ncbi:hypothetical protein [Ferrimonas balearica]|uniref:hypothetical protein n=1 Tax=Ferrimonas balearica TaxID=44012 RepID=UPI001C59AC15|nr:hypothetical protein [Ferrimonas balearica]MBW3163498.1 hypothetical protein [Ferrimonas balearica]